MKELLKLVKVIREKCGRRARIVSDREGRLEGVRRGFSSYVRTTRAASSHLARC